MNNLLGYNKQSERDLSYCDQTALSFCDKFQEWFEHQFPELMQDEYYAGKKFSHSVCEDYGTTPIVQWIKYAHRKPILQSPQTPHRGSELLSGASERLRQSEIGSQPSIAGRPYEVLPKQLTFGKWSCRRHFVDRGHPGYQPIHYWIMYRQGEPIPQQLLFKGVEKAKHELDQTPLYMWIRYRPGEPIPNQLKYEGWQKDESVKTFTPLMMWLKYRPTEPIPEDIMYDDWKTYSRKESPYSFESSTPLFVWADNHPEKPIPETLIYEGCGSSLSERGDTLLHAWMDKMCERYTPFLMRILQERQMLGKIQIQIPELIIPEVLKFPGWQRSRNRHNKTPIAIYVQRWPRAAEMPAEMLYDGCQDDITGENSNLLTCWFANYNVMQKPVEPPEWILPKNSVSDEIKLKWYLTWVQNPYNDLEHIPSILLDQCVLQQQPPNVKNPTRKFGKAVTRYLNAMGHVEDEIYKSVFVFRQWCDGVKNIPNNVSFPEELKQLINDHIPDQVQKPKRSRKQ